MEKSKPDQTPCSDFKSISAQGGGLVLVSAATLCFEINLTRLFSVSQFYHFAFMVVSMALLGFGASGTFLAMRKATLTAEGKAFPWLAGASGACMLGAYVLVNTVPFDSFSMAVDPSQIAILFLHYAALASPFFFSGMVISMMLRRYSTSGGEVYALNLAGSAAGCVGAVLAPQWVDGEGAAALSAATAALAGVLFTIGERKKTWDGKLRLAGAPVFIGAVLTASLVLLGFRIHSGAFPAFFELHISPYKSISYVLQYGDARVVSSRWNSFSKVDVVRSASLHSVPGLSYRYLEPLPAMDGLFVDGDNLNVIAPADAEMDFAEYLPAAATFRLRPQAEALVLEPAGGLDVLAALASGAERVTVAEGNPLLLEAAQDIYVGERVELVRSSGRSFLRGCTQLYDIIQLPLTDSYHPVGSGAYSLGEDYRYTVESVSNMIDSLKPDGMLLVTRWLQEEPSEWLRTFTLAVTALEKQGLDPLTRIVALRGYNTGTLLIKKSSYQESELDTIRSFASEKAFDLVYAPGIQEAEINRFNILPEEVYYRTFQDFLQASPRNSFYKSYPYDVRPPTDNHPFFGHYFKWLQIDDILRELGSTWQPFGGAGYVAILVIFIMSLILSGVLILLPAAVMRRPAAWKRTKRVPLYFGLIGLAFMLVEMPLIQRFILYLDQPAYAMAVVLFCILFFSGLGSSIGSRRLALSRAVLWLVGLLGLYALLLPDLLYATLGFPLTVRVGFTIMLIAPIGFLMGIPFPGGLAWARSVGQGKNNPTGRWMVAWVWAVNGASSVVASILASLLALSFGFGVTTWVGTGCYLLAWGVARRKP